MSETPTAAEGRDTLIARLDKWLCVYDAQAGANGREAVFAEIVREARAALVAQQQEIAELQKALRAVIDEPYGCPFCDSGVLRNPVKSHLEDCGFALAKKVLR